jgi:hypothetical protein
VPAESAAEKPARPFDTPQVTLPFACTSARVPACTARAPTTSKDATDNFTNCFIYFSFIYKKITNPMDSPMDSKKFILYTMPRQTFI